MTSLHTLSTYRVHTAPLAASVRSSSLRYEVRSMKGSAPSFLGSAAPSTLLSLASIVGLSDGEKSKLLADRHLLERPSTAGHADELRVELLLRSVALSHWDSFNPDVLCTEVVGKKGGLRPSTRTNAPLDASENSCTGFEAAA